MVSFMSKNKDEYKCFWNESSKNLKLSTWLEKNNTWINSNELKNTVDVIKTRSYDELDNESYKTEWLDFSLDNVYKDNHDNFHFDRLSLAPKEQLFNTPHDLQSPRRLSHSLEKKLSTNVFKNEFKEEENKKNSIYHDELASNSYQAKNLDLESIKNKQPILEQMSYLNEIQNENPEHANDKELELFDPNRLSNDKNWRISQPSNLSISSVLKSAFKPVSEENNLNKAASKDKKQIDELFNNSSTSSKKVDWQNLKLYNSHKKSRNFFNTLKKKSSPCKDLFENNNDRLLPSFNSNDYHTVPKQPFQLNKNNTIRFSNVDDDHRSSIKWREKLHFELKLLKLTENDGFGIVPVTNNFTQSVSYDSKIKLMDSPKFDSTRKIALISVQFKKKRLGFYQCYNTLPNSSITIEKFLAQCKQKCICPMIIIEMDGGFDLGMIVSTQPFKLTAGFPEAPFMPIIRLATEKDFQIRLTRQLQENKIFSMCQYLLKEQSKNNNELNKLANVIQIQDVELQLDCSRLLIFAILKEKADWNLFCQRIFQYCVFFLNIRPRVWIQRKFKTI